MTERKSLDVFLITPLLLMFKNIDERELNLFLMLGFELGLGFVKTMGKLLCTYLLFMFCEFFSPILHILLIICLKTLSCSVYVHLPSVFQTMDVQLAQHHGKFIPGDLNCIQEEVICQIYRFWVGNRKQGVGNGEGNRSWCG